MDNRSNIMDCALALFAARGYDAVGIQEVVEAAGITKPTLYHYFTNKRGLLNALLEQHFTALLESVRAAAQYQHDLPLTLEKTARTYFAFAGEHPQFYRMQLGMYFSPPDSEPHQAVLRYSLEQHQLLEDLFAQSVVENGNLRGRQRQFAATFLGMINTYIGLSLNQFIQLDDSLAYQSVHQFMHGIWS
jgi:AcrR family transcriptional regulator